MRFKIFFFLAFFATSAVTAQLYDNRNRYLQSPHSYNRFDQELEGLPKKPAKRYTPSRTTSSRNSYNHYRNRVNRYSRAYLTTDDFYRRFRDPNVHRRFSNFIEHENGFTTSLNRNPEKSLKFQCFCFVPIDINSLFNFYSSIDSEIKANRERIINIQEQEYSKEMSKRGFSKNYGETFKDQQKRFFNRYVQKFNYGYEQGRKTSYRDHKERLVNELKYTAERFDDIFEKEIAVNVVFDFLKRYKSNPRNTAKPKKHVGDLKIGQQFLYDIPSSNYNNYNMAKLFLRTGNRSALKQLAVRNIYHNIRNLNNLNDYLKDRYIKQYDNEYDLNKRFAFQSAYLIDYLAGHQLTPLNKNQIHIKYDFSGYMSHVKYDRNKIMDFYKSNSTANSSHFMSFEKAKAIMAINSFPSNVKSTIEMDGNIKNSVMNYLENAIPMNYELNTIRDAINSRYNDAFKWSELPYFRTRSFQKKENPKAIMSIYLEKTTFEWFYLRQYGVEGSLILDLGPTRYAYKMHKGIGDVLKKMYNNPIYASKEGATLRHFLESKTNIKIPSSLSNYDLGKLFDFGGGNSNTLTIEFSDYAKKYITNFHHGDGIYGTSLFTNLAKLAGLFDILKGEPVDFATTTKPCLGDPVPNPQIAPQKNSGIAGGMYGCTRNGSGCVGQLSKKYHGGMDFKAHYGQPIFAMYDGDAKLRTQYNKKGTSVVGAGHYVEITSTINGKTVKALYFHLKKNNRKSGKVKAGDVIGYLGDSGNLKTAIKQGYAESHLHVKVKENGSAVNPNNYLSNKINPKTGRYNYPSNCK